MVYKRVVSMAAKMVALKGSMLVDTMEYHSAHNLVDELVESMAG
jgi:hypothetical protein